MSKSNGRPIYDDKFYPNLIVKDAEGFKQLERIEQFKEGKDCPKIRWGSEYKKQSLRWRLRYAEGVASAMNHAADLLQTERNDLLKLCRDQNDLIEQLTRDLATNSTTHETAIHKLNQSTQWANEAVMEKQEEIKKLRDAFQRLRSLFFRYMDYVSCPSLPQEEDGFTESEIKSLKRLEELAGEYARERDEG